MSLMYIAFFEVVAVVWIYGAGRLAGNVRDMTGSSPNLYIQFCWWVAAPCLILAIWIFSLADYQEPTYNNGKYIYPPWSIGLGWAIALLSLVAIPVWGAIAVYQAKGNNILQVRGTFFPNHSCLDDYKQFQVIGHCFKLITVCMCYLQVSIVMFSMNFYKTFVFYDRNGELLSAQLSNSAPVAEKTWSS